MTLKTELSTDPLVRGYAAMGHDVAAADLNSVYRTRVQETYVTDRTLFSKLGPTEAEVILVALAGSTNPAVIRANGWITSAIGFNIGDPVAQVMIDSLVTAGLFTAAQGAELKNLAVVTCSRAQELGLGTVTPQDVYNARVI